MKLIILLLVECIFPMSVKNLISQKLPYHTEVVEVARVEAWLFDPSFENSILSVLSENETT